MIHIWSSIPLFFRVTHLKHWTLIINRSIMLFLYKFFIVLQLGLESNIFAHNSKVLSSFKGFFLHDRFEILVTHIDLFCSFYQQFKTLYQYSLFSSSLIFLCRLLWLIGCEWKVCSTFPIDSSIWKFCWKKNIYDIAITQSCILTFW